MIRNPAHKQVTPAPAVTLTPLERKVLRVLFESSAGNGHDFGFIEDGRKAVDQPRQLGGVVTSLVKKGVIFVYEAVRTDSGLWTQFDFSNNGYDAERVAFAESLCNG